MTFTSETAATRQVNIEGKRVGMLVASERLPGGRYVCHCDCGNTRIVKTGHFNTGAVKSCGCHKDLRPKRAEPSWKAEVILVCAHCGEAFDRGYRISSRRAAKKQFCSPECQAGFYARPDKECETCGKMFHPRSAEKTKFCSMACNTTGIAAILTEEVQRKRLQGTITAHREGRVPHLRGAENPNWKGGPKATYARLQANGVLAERTKAYRRSNPDKVREFSERRSGRKIGRLPHGTIPRLRQAQRNRCAICRTSLKAGYHVDHIKPLAKGGAHEPRNIQLLCPTCNVRKSSRDPIDYMQSLGRLL